MSPATTGTQTPAVNPATAETQLEMSAAVITSTTGGPTAAAEATRALTTAEMLTGVETTV